MSLYQKINPFSKINNDTGFATNSSDTGGRFLNKDGSYNLVKVGMPFRKRFSMFHDMLNLPTWKFITVIFLFYIIINIIFTFIYFGLGPSQFDGLIPGNDWKIFRELLYFSTQTITTVGYGHVSPVGDGVNVVAAIEALTGFLSLAIATGLIYGRFSKPKSYLIFSDHALISPYKNGVALMFRFAGYKDMHSLTDLEVRVNTGLLLVENGKPDYKYFTLDLERTKVESMAMSWTVVHPIDEKSPFYGFTKEDMKNADAEIYVSLRGFDDVFSNYVQQRTSYTYNEILFNRKFIPMFRESDDGKTTILELHKLNVHKAINVSTDNH
jgi:inward rectifier potassium channel